MDSPNPSPNHTSNQLGITGFQSSNTIHAHSPPLGLDSFASATLPVFRRSFSDPSPKAYQEVVTPPDSVTGQMPNSKLNLPLEKLETEKPTREMEDEERSRGELERGLISYCVTGATGYIGSWLVKSLLQRGYTVHATVRDPARASHLIRLWGGGDRLRVFRADLQEEGSFDKAVRGCSGVFHVAASMEFEVRAKEDIDTYARTNFIEPAINGTLNLLKACTTESVKRVVFTSSISTLTAKDSSGKWRSVVDESCQNPVDHVWKTKPSGWIYVLSKLLTEEAALEFAKQNKIDLVSVITSTVAGAFLTSIVPASLRVLLSPITGDPKFSSILNGVNSRMGSVALVHIEDICSAHIFLMEHARAEGRYICSSGSCVLSELVDKLAMEYCFSNVQRIVEEEHGPIPSEISSKKLRDLGFNFKYGLEDIINHTVNSCIDCGLLCPVVTQEYYANTETE